MHIGNPCYYIDRRNRDKNQRGDEIQVWEWLSEMHGERTGRANTWGQKVNSPDCNFYRGIKGK